MKYLDKYIETQRNDKIKTMPFIDYIYFIMDMKNLTPSEVYKNADIDRRTWSKIISNQMIPSLEMTVKIAIGLQLTNEECKILLKKLNYTLSRSSDFALVIRYCLDNKIYSLIKINELLYEKGSKTL